MSSILLRAALLAGAAADSNPTWSANAKWIAFESNRHRERTSYGDSDISS